MFVSVLACVCVHMCVSGDVTVLCLVTVRFCSRLTEVTLCIRLEMNQSASNLLQVNLI